MRKMLYKKKNGLILEENAIKNCVMETDNIFFIFVSFFNINFGQKNLLKIE